MARESGWEGVVGQSWTARLSVCLSGSESLMLKGKTFEKAFTPFSNGRALLLSVGPEPQSTNTHSKSYFTSPELQSQPVGCWTSAEAETVSVSTQGDAHTDACVCVRGKRDVRKGKRFALGALREGCNGGNCPGICKRKHIRTSVVSEVLPLPAGL